MNTKKIILLFTTFINYLGIGLVYPIFALLLFDRSLGFVPLHTSDTLRGFYLGALLALMPLTQFFCSTLLGKLSDLFGSKPIFMGTLSIGFIGYAIALLAITQESLLALFIYRTLVGISAANSAVIQSALVSDTQEASGVSKNFSLFNMAMGAGYTIGPFLGGFLSEPSFLFAGTTFTTFAFGTYAIGMNLAIVTLFYREHQMPLQALKSPLKPETLLSTDLSLTRNTTPVLGKRDLRPLFICSFIFSFGWSFFFEFVPVFLIGQYGLTSVQIGNFYGFAGAFYAISCAFLIHPLLKRMPFERVLFIAFITAGIYSFLFLLIKEPIFIWCYSPFLIYLIALIYPTTSMMVSSLTLTEHQGEVLGSLLATQSLAFAISPLISGFLVGIYHQMPILLGGISFLSAGALFGYSYFRRVETL